MMNRQYRDARRAFINGDADELRLGGYGGTITVSIVPGGVLIRTTKPKRRQRKLTPESRSVRETAVRAAEAALERIRGVPTKRRIQVARRKATPIGVITPRDVWLAYLRPRLGAIPEDEVLGWGRKQVATYMRRLSPAVREAAPSAAYIYSIIQAARRLHRDGVVPLDGDLADIQPGDLDEWVTAQLAAGSSAHTLATYRNRFRNAVRRFKEKYPHQWGDLFDPTDGVARIATAHIQPPEIGEERAARILARLRTRGAWRALATAMIVHATGRRVASISGSREDLHWGAPPLCAADFRRAENGVLEVTWRANAQKGGAYGRGDVVLPATRQLKLVYRWLTRYYSNPVGPEHPLIWSEEDPSRAEPYHRLRRELAAAWRDEYGEEIPRGLGWHAFCRTTITTLADMVGPLMTGEYTGRSAEIVERTYKRVRPDTARIAAQHLDKVRRRQLIRLRPAGDPDAVTEKAVDVSGDNSARAGSPDNPGGRVNA